MTHMSSSLSSFLLPHAQAYQGGAGATHDASRGGDGVVGGWMGEGGVGLAGAQGWVGDM
jgi:hypothetical protein